MLKAAKTFSSFSTNNIVKAKAFYGKTLGIKVVEVKKMGILELHLAKGAQAMIYPKPDHKAASFTVLNFLVKDINKTVSDLGKKVKFEKYNFGKGMKTDKNGIMRNSDGSAIAWFKDPAGNTLSVIQEK